MNDLKQFLDQNKAIYKPVNDENIIQAEVELSIVFSDEYKRYLKQIGLFTYESIETYGLGLPNDSYLNIIKSTQEFRQESGFQDSFVPLCEIGDGHYYIYDNNESNIKVWVSPNGGVSKNINGNLEDFLLNLIKTLA